LRAFLFTLTDAPIRICFFYIVLRLFTARLESLLVDFFGAREFVSLTDTQSLFADPGTDLLALMFLSELFSHVLPVFPRPGFFLFGQKFCIPNSLLFPPCDEVIFRGWRIG